MNVDATDPRQFAVGSAQIIQFNKFFDKVYTCMYLCTCMRVHTHTHTRTHVHTHTHARMHAHTHTHTTGHRETISFIISDGQ